MNIILEMSQKYKKADASNTKRYEKLLELLTTVTSVRGG